MTDVSERELHEAEARMQARLAAGPHAVAARYDRGASKIVVSLSSGVELAFPPHLAEGLSDAQPDDLEEIEITPTGLGLHFPHLDADLYVPALLQGVLGSSAWMAQTLGAKGDSSTSELKAAAARANGKLGGRPRLGAAAAGVTKPKGEKAMPTKPVKKPLAVRGKRVAKGGNDAPTGRPPKGVVRG